SRASAARCSTMWREMGLSALRATRATVGRVIRARSYSRCLGKMAAWEVITKKGAASVEPPDRHHLQEVLQVVVVQVPVDIESALLDERGNDRYRDAGNDPSRGLCLAHPRGQHEGQDAQHRRTVLDDDVKELVVPQHPRHVDRVLRQDN